MVLTRQRHKIVIASIEHGMMRPIDLVETEDIIINVKCLHVNEPMWSIGYCVDTDPSAMGVSNIGEFTDGIDGAEDV